MSNRETNNQSLKPLNHIPHHVKLNYGALMIVPPRLTEKTDNNATRLMIEKISAAKSLE